MHILIIIKKILAYGQHDKHNHDYSLNFYYNVVYLKTNFRNVCLLILIFYIKYILSYTGLQ